MGQIYFPLLYFIVTAFIFIQLIPIYGDYGELNSNLLDIKNLFKNNFKSSNVVGETIQSTESPNQKFVIKQQNNVGFEVCTGSGSNVVCTIQEGDTISFILTCSSTDLDITVKCITANKPPDSEFESETGNPADATFTWTNAGPPGNYTLGPVQAICVSEPCTPSNLITITIVVNGPSTSKDEFIKQAFEKICQDPNTDFSTLSKQELVDINKVISARYAALYFEKPEAFKWAGMASYASGLVGWGLWGAEQIHTLNKKTPGAELLFNSLREGNIELYRDIGWQHEAFLSEEGIKALERIKDQGGLSLKQFKGWEKIDEGLRTNNPQLVREGNKDLLEFEQTEFLQNKVYEPNKEFWESYTKNEKLPLFSPIFPWYSPDDFRHYINKNHPGVDPNIGDPEQRWNWVSNNMLPHYQFLESSRAFHDVTLRHHLILGEELCPNVKPQL